MHIDKDPESVISNRPPALIIYSKCLLIYTHYLIYIYINTSKKKERKKERKKKV